eukprot:196481-Chlamydomonas_euryale.AAC.1
MAHRAWMPTARRSSYGCPHRQRPKSIVVCAVKRPGTMSASHLGGLAWAPPPPPPRRAPTLCSAR